MSRRDAVAPARRPSREELNAEIRLARAELAGTVQALAAKADLRARARGEVARLGERMAEAAGWARPGDPVIAAQGSRVRREAYLPAGVLLGIGALVVAGFLLRRGRRG